MRTWGPVGLLLLAASSQPALAGPCSAEIRSAQIQFDNRQKASATKGPAAPESTAATLHRQPTPKSLAMAKGQTRHISDDDAKVFGEDMQRARAADASGDKAACEAALKDALAILTH